MKRIMKDLVNKKNDYISNKSWMMKKEKGIWDELWKMKNNLYETNYGRSGQQKK